MIPPVFEDKEEVIAEFPLRTYKKRRWPRRLFFTFFVLIIILALAWWQQERITELFFPAEDENVARSLGTEPLELWSGGGQGRTILLIGADRRAGFNEEWGRSDTIILARVMPGERAVSLLSLPRDLQVEIPGYGFDKINAAYSYGGPALLIKTVRDFVGAKIDHFIEIDFSGFARMVKETDGVYLPIDQKYYHSNEGLSEYEMYSEIDIEPGYQRLGPEDALAFVRYRHTDSDFLRAARQQLFLRELSRQVQGSLADGSIGSRWDLLRAFLEETRSDMRSLREALAIGQAVRNIPSERIVRVVMQADSFVSGGVFYLSATPEQKEEALEIWNNPSLLLESGGPAKSTELGRLFLKSSNWLVGYSKGRPFKVEIEDNRAPLSSVSRLLKRWRPLLYPTNATFAPIRKEIFLARSSSYGSQNPKEKDTDIALVESPAPEMPASSLRPCQPSLLPEGYSWQEPRAYKVEEKPTIALSATAPAASGILWSWSAWKKAPVLRSPDETVKKQGRTFFLWTESGAPRVIAWRSGNGYGWLHNTLDNLLDRESMFEMALSCRQ